MIFDKENLFSDAQAITVTAASTNVIDLGKTGRVPYASADIKRDIGPGVPIPLRVQVVEDFTGLTNLTVALQVSDTENFTSSTTVASQQIVLADLKAGGVFGGLYHIPRGTNGRYVRLQYTVAGTGTGGKVTAGIVAGHQENPA